MIEEKTRIDQYLSKKLDISRSKVQKLIKENKVKVNGKDVNSSYVVSSSDQIDVEDDLNYELKLEEENIPLDIVYEDDYLLIINKKSGMIVHPGAGNYNHTLVNALLYRYKNLPGENFRVGIVHRIDKDTSGLMVVAKEEKTMEYLSNMIANKQIERKYLALVEGVIPNESGTIDAPIGRDINNRLKMMVTKHNSKNAVTHFKVLKRYKNNTLIECKLETGRTHQIRVHMAYIGYPIVNDPVYSKNKNTTSFGQMLHSYSIKFIHPITKKEIYITCNPPKKFLDKEKEFEEE